MPADSPCIEQVGHSGVFKTGIGGRRFDARGIDQSNPLIGWRCTTGIECFQWVLGFEQRTANARRRSSSKDELMGWITGPFVGLEHPICEGILLSQREIRLNF